MRFSQALLAAVGICVVSLSATATFAQSTEPKPTLDLPSLPKSTVVAPPPPPELLVERHEWLRVVYHPALFELAQSVTRDAVEVRATLVAILGRDVLGEVEVRLARTPEELELLSPREAPPPASVNGAQWGPLHLVVLGKPSDGSGATFDDSLRHQLAHLALFDAVGGRPMPRWFQEGFAVHMSGEGSFRRTRSLVSASLGSSLLPISQLDTAFDDAANVRLAFAESADFVAFLANDPTAFSGLVARLRAGALFEVALAEAYGADVHTLEARWRSEVTRRWVTQPLVVAGIVGWLLAVTALVLGARRRRRKALANARTLDDEARALLLREAAERADEEHAVGKLLVVDEGVGHVVYMVERPRVPKVEHDGKMHTLH